MVFAFNNCDGLSSFRNLKGMIKLLDRIGLIWKITRFQIALRKVSRIGFTYCSATCTLTILEVFALGYIVP